MGIHLPVLTKMKILKAAVSIEGENETCICDTIEHKGKLWLVPGWIEKPLEGYSRPARIICLSLLPHQKRGANFPVQYVLSKPIPKSVLDGQIPKKPKFFFQIVEAPDIFLDIRS